MKKLIQKFIKTKGGVVLHWDNMSKSRYVKQLYLFGKPSGIIENRRATRVEILKAFNNI